MPLHGHVGLIEIQSVVPDHAVFNVTKDELKAMPEFKYST